LLDAWWTYVIVYVVIITLICLDVGLGEYFKKQKKKRDEEAAKEQEATDRERLHGQTEVIGKVTDSLGEEE